MALKNGMQGSEVLDKKIFGEQPHVSSLQQKVTDLLVQLAPERKHNLEIQQALGRIGSLSETLNTLAGGTREELVALYTETVATTHFSNYAQQVAVLESHQRDRVASLLGASNNDTYSQAA